MIRLFQLLSNYRWSVFVLAAGVVATATVTVGAKPATVSDGVHSPPACTGTDCQPTSPQSGPSTPTPAPSVAASSAMSGVPGTSSSSVASGPTSTPTTTPGTPATAGPTILPTRTVTATPKPSVSISISISVSISTPPSPTPTLPEPTKTRTPRNKALGLKEACLIDKPKWVIKMPCPQAHRGEAMI